MERDAEALLRRDEAALTRLVRRSVEIKAEVVSGDEREAGRRAILNAGHTVAHALEQATGYGLPHGEAVALGLVAECALAEALGVAPPGPAPAGVGAARAARPAGAAGRRLDPERVVRGDGERQEEPGRASALRAAQRARGNGRRGAVDTGGAGRGRPALAAGHPVTDQSGFSTSTGVNRSLCDVPSPSWPCSLSPQQNARLLVVTPQV